MFGAKHLFSPDFLPNALFSAKQCIFMTMFGDKRCFLPKQMFGDKQCLAPNILTNIFVCR